MIRKFVTAALRGMKDMMDNPDKAADEFVSVRAGLEGQGRRRQDTPSTCTPSTVYSGQKVLGEINADRLAKLQDFYLEKGFIQKKTPVDELYTNEFVN